MIKSSVSDASGQVTAVSGSGFAPSDLSVLNAAGVPDRAALGSAFETVRGWSTRLAAPLAPEDQVVQSMPDASPTKWHLAHVTWFFETFILKHFHASYRPVHDGYDYLFNSYYEGLSSGFYSRPDRGKISRPTVAEVMDFRSEIDRRMVRLMEVVDDRDWAELAKLVVLGLHHEQQHQELLLTDIKHALSFNPLFPAYRTDLAGAEGDGGGASSGDAVWQSFDGGVVEIGHDGDGFHFDCEGPRHQIYVQDYKLAGRLVTNAEYLAFMEDGGYEQAALWLSEGWAWIKETGTQAPLYWSRDGDGEVLEFTLGGRRALNPAAPVTHLSYFEADAFAAWAGARLPTEAEWENAASRQNVPMADANLLAGDALHPLPAGKGAQFIGDVWEWTSSSYAAYPGFKPLPGVVGEYNGKFMSNQYVLRGGSCVTPPGHMRMTYRNFFPTSARWQFTGLRLARDA